MTRVPPVATAPVTTALDGFGSRTIGVDAKTGDEIELLDLAPLLVEHSGFVAALGERVARFATVKHASYVHLRRLDRPSTDRLELVSDFTPGWRLSDLLAESTAANIPLDISVIIGLLRQLLPAVALFGRHNREAAIGSLAVERVIVTPQARLVIAEHAFGPALDKLNLGRERLWHELRVAMPPSAGLPRSNQRADANAIGVFALSLLLGRTLELAEYPAQLESLVEDAKEHRDGQPSPLSTTFSNWLKRALQLDVRTAFQAPSEAQLAFESVLASDRSYVTSSAKLDEWVAKVGGILDAKRRPAEPEPPPRSPEPEPSPVAPEPAPGPIAIALPVMIEEVRPEAVAEETTPEPIAAEASPELSVEEARHESRDEDAPSYEEDTSLPAPSVWTPSSEPQSESASYEARELPANTSRMPQLIMAGVIALLIGAVIWLMGRSPAAPRSGNGELVVTSRPAGANVSIDGTSLGVTPLTVPLRSGAHVLEVQIGKSEPRVIPLTIQANVQTAQYIELQGVQATGSLEIKSEPSGARVMIDGQPRGTTPAAIRDLPAGDHAVVLELGGRKVTQAVKIDPGGTSKLVVPIPRR